MIGCGRKKESERGREGQRERERESQEERDSYKNQEICSEGESIDESTFLQFL